jgi:putative ABC transport system permease protein
VNLLEAARIALRGLRANKLRSGLTTLGIVIGISAVIILVALGNGVQSWVNENIGPFAMQIMITQTQGAAPGGGVAKDLTDADVEALENPAKAPDIERVTPLVGGSALLQTEEGKQFRASVTGSTADYLTVTDRDMLVGRGLTEDEVRTKAKVVVLGPNAVRDLWAGDASAALGKPLRIGRTQFRVVGVVKSNGQDDDIAYMPLGAARSYLVGGENEKVNTIFAKARSAEVVPAALDQVNKVLSDRHKISDPAKRDFNARSFQSQVENFTQTINVLSLFTAAVAAISLLVGSIGVANIMLVTVTERTREIGIRKAIGARYSAILKQFLLESMMLAGFGGVIGIIIGVSLSIVARFVLPEEFPKPDPSISSIVLSFTVSLLIGLIAGGYPANRAARLRPIEALRYQ